MVEILGKIEDNLDNSGPSIGYLESFIDSWELHRWHFVTKTTSL